LKVDAVVLVLSLPFPAPREHVKALRGTGIERHILLETWRPPHASFKYLCQSPLIAVQKVGQIITFSDRTALIRAANKPEELIACFCGSVRHEDVRAQVALAGLSGCNALNVTL
jgi:hypothetical protein